MTRFVILTTQRSGSTVLTRTLDEHPDIFCAGEIFHESKEGIHHPEWHFKNWKLTGNKHSKLNKLINYPNLKFNAASHIKKFFAEDKTIKAKGCKLMYSQIKNAPFIWQYIQDNNIKIIVLIRKNAFKMALSRYRMQQSGMAHTTEVVQSSTITVPAQAVLKQTLQLEEVNEKLLAISQKNERLVLHYEDFEKWTELMQKVNAFLQVPFIDMPPVLKKVAADDWRTEVKNYKEVEDIFKENRADKYLIHS